MPLKHWLYTILNMLGFACGFFGIFFIIIGFMAIEERYQTQTWIAHEAVISQSQLSYYHDSKHKKWYAKISVRFTHQLDTDEKKVAVAYGRYLGIGEQVKQTARDDITRYPVGKIVTVYQNPKKPNSIVLERLAWQERLDLIGIGLLLLLIPLSMRYIKKRLKN